LPIDAPQSPSSADPKTQVALADTENRIDGITRDPQTDVVFEAYIAGEIPVTEITARLHTLLGL
jgi:hypothetical protein